MAMPGPAVPGNAIQRRMRGSEQHALRPDSYTLAERRGVIVKAWLRAEREDEGSPLEKAALLARNPGMIMVLVADLNGKTHTVRLKISLDELYSVYGNAVNLVGRPVLLRYPNEDISLAFAVLSSDDLNRPLREDEMIDVYDIGVGF